MGTPEDLRDRPPALAPYLSRAEDLTAQEQRQFCFNHALRHMTQHWAGYMIILGALLVRVGQPQPGRFGRYVAVLLVLASWYFLYRMWIFWKELNNLLP